MANVPDPCSSAMFSWAGMLKAAPANSMLLVTFLAVLSGVEHATMWKTCLSCSKRLRRHVWLEQIELMLVWNHVWLPTLYGAGTHGYAEQWVYSCLLLFFSLFIRLWSRPVDVQRYAYFFEKTDVERRGPAYYQHHCWIFLTLGVTRAGRPLPIQETSGGDSSRNVNLDTGQRSWTRLRF